MPIKRLMDPRRMRKSPPPRFGLDRSSPIGRWLHRPLQSPGSGTLMFFWSAPPTPQGLSYRDPRVGRRYAIAGNW